MVVLLTLTYLILYNDKRGLLKMLSENDKKEELSYAYVHAVSSYAGYSCERTSKDRDSIDTRICAKGNLTSNSKTSSPSIEIQLKATCDLAEKDNDNYSFPLPIKNYDDLRAKSLCARYLVILDLPADQKDWLTLSKDSLVKKRCAYWVSLLNEPEVPNNTNKTVYIPKLNVFDSAALKQMLESASELKHLI